MIETCDPFETSPVTILFVHMDIHLKHDRKGGHLDGSSPAMMHHRTRVRVHMSMSRPLNPVLSMRVCMCVSFVCVSVCARAFVCAHMSLSRPPNTVLNPCGVCVCGGGVRGVEVTKEGECGGGGVVWW